MSTTTTKKRPVRFGYTRTKNGEFFPVIIGANGKPMLNEPQKRLAQLKRTFANLAKSIRENEGVEVNIIEVPSDHVWPKNSKRSSAKKK